MTVTILESNEARAHWAKLLQAAADGDADIVITRSGEPMTVMIRYEDYLAIQASLRMHV